MKKLLFLFATALSLSVIFAAGWASGKNVETASLHEPASVQSEEHENPPRDNERVRDSDVEKDDFDGVHPDDKLEHHHKMPKFRFNNLVLPGIHKQP